MNGFLDSVRAFHGSVLARDDAAQRLRLAQVQDRLVTASADDLYAAASLLSDVLHAVPPRRDAAVAVVIGACVEGGTDPATCAEPVVHRAQLALEADPPPGPDAVADWEAAVVAVLATAYIRRALLPRPDLLAAARAVGARELVTVLALLDDEPLVVVDRTTGDGYQFVMGGISSLRQLGDLLAQQLSGSFELVAPDGTLLPADGVPADVPVVDGTRLLVLDPPLPATGAPHPPGGPVLDVEADLRLELRLTPDAVARWTAHVAPPAYHRPVAEPEPEERKRWWQR